MGSKGVEYFNDEISAKIDNMIHSERDRAILKRWYVDGIHQEPLAEEFGLSPRQIRNIIYKAEKILFK